MSRTVTDDFEKLKAFFSGYTTANNIGNSQFISFLSAFHKKYLAFLTYLAELSKYKTKKDLACITDKQFLFYSESCSDCGLALFDAVNGNYKAARFLMRSSIENFIKAVCLDMDTSIDQESSVYQIFDRAKATPFFSRADANGLYDAIHNGYKELCKDVHTASLANMTGLSALNVFPTFNQLQADRLIKIVQSLIMSYVTLLALKYNKHYHSIIFVNKEVIENGIIKDYAEVINNK